MVTTVGADTQITDLTVNDHACLTFGEHEEQLDLTAAFVRDGLSSGLKVVWLRDTAPAQAVSELGRRGIAVESAVAAGQMTAAACEGRLLSGHAFAADHAMGWLTGEMATCRQEGFPGLRVAVDMSWALRPVTGVEIRARGSSLTLTGPHGSVLRLLSVTGLLTWFDVPGAPGTTTSSQVTSWPRL